MWWWMIRPIHYWKKPRVETGIACHDRQTHVPGRLPTLCDMATRTVGHVCALAMKCSWWILVQGGMVVVKEQVVKREIVVPNQW